MEVLWGGRQSHRGGRARRDMRHASLLLRTTQSSVPATAPTTYCWCRSHLPGSGNAATLAFCDHSLGHAYCIPNATPTPSPAPIVVGAAPLFQRAHEAHPRWCPALLEAAFRKQRQRQQRRQRGSLGPHRHGWERAAAAVAQRWLRREAGAMWHAAPLLLFHFRGAARVRVLLRSAVVLCQSRCVSCRRCELSNRCAAHLAQRRAPS